MIARSLDELLVYGKALAACYEVSAVVERPNLSKDYELRTQLTSAAGSIPANIAEGFAQQTDRQFVRYLCFARGGSRRSAVSSQQSAVGSRQSAVSSRQSAVGSQQSAVGSQPSAVAAMAWDVPSAAI